VSIEFVTQHARGDYRVLRVLPPQRLEFVVSGLVDHEVFFKPAGLAIRRLHFEEAAFMIEDLQFFAIVDRSDFCRHRRDAITQPRLLGRDIHHIGCVGRSVMAPGRKCERPRHGNARSERENTLDPSVLGHDLFQVYRRRRTLAIAFSLHSVRLSIAQRLTVLYACAAKNAPARREFGSLNPSVLRIGRAIFRISQSEPLAEVVSPAGGTPAI
jgi:hypothetical protein